jgi:hypothetical protein
LVKEYLAMLFGEFGDQRLGRRRAEHARRLLGVQWNAIWH